MNADPSLAGGEAEAGRGFRHAVLPYADDDEYLGALVPFIADGVRAGEPVMVAVPEPRAELISEHLGEAAGAVEIVDMAEIGRNPGRIIPAWQAFVDGHPARAVRGVGEPAWEGRSEAELEECQRHEQLLALAFTDVHDFNLVCPYDANRLPPAVVDRVCRSHPERADARGTSPCEAYEPPDRGPSPLAGRLPPPPPEAEQLEFGSDRDLRRVRALVTACARRAGLARDRCADLALAASELATNSLRHGGGHGRLWAWTEEGAIVCELADRGSIKDPLAGRRVPSPIQERGWGLYLVHLLCDLVEVRSGEVGTRIRIRMIAG